ncbi:hypothetical protein GOODEAATRI_028526 [Goodea atripinnis]|uniref:Uncharacterized protein n=1 Tax=Goodea atripinnis TaxID=208336 RepID=A0ABV0NYF8_9TELE
MWQRLFGGRGGLLAPYGEYKEGHGSPPFYHLLSRHKLYCYVMSESKANQDQAMTTIIIKIAGEQSEAPSPNEGMPTRLRRLKGVGGSGPHLVTPVPTRAWAQSWSRIPRHCERSRWKGRPPWQTTSGPTAKRLMVTLVKSSQLLLCSGGLSHVLQCFECSRAKDFPRNHRESSQLLPTGFSQGRLCLPDLTPSMN